MTLAEEDRLVEAMVSEWFKRPNGSAREWMAAALRIAAPVIRRAAIWDARVAVMILIAERGMSIDLGRVTEALERLAETPGDKP